MKYITVLLLAWGFGRLSAQPTATLTIFSNANDAGIPVFCGIGSDILVSGRVSPINAQTLGGTLTAQVVMTVDAQGTETEYDAQNPAPNTLIVPQIVSFNSSLGLFTYRVYFANHSENPIVRYRIDYTLVTGEVISGEFQTANYDVQFNVPQLSTPIPSCADPVVLDQTGSSLPDGFPLENVTYSGPGVGVNANGEVVFNPGVAGVGTHAITYGGVYRGCTISKSIPVTVTQTPEVQIIGTPATVCKLSENEVRVGLRLLPSYIDETDSPFSARIQTSQGTQDLTVEPVAGTDSVYVIIPANSNSGTVRLRYQYLAGACDEETIEEFGVNEVANLNLGIISPTVANLNEPICFIAGTNNALRLEGVPMGGTFTLLPESPSATIVDAGVGIDFVPSVSGTYKIRYTVINSTCEFSVEQELRFVAPAFPAQFFNILDTTQFCSAPGDQTITFGLSNPGAGNTGRYYDGDGNEFQHDGSNTYNYTFALSPPRTVTLVYEVTESGGCVTRDTIRIRILNSILANVRYPTLNKEALSDTFCKDANVVLPLEVTPLGGTISPQIIGGQQVAFQQNGVWNIRPIVTGQHVFLYSGFQGNCPFNRIFIVTVLDPGNAGPVSLTTAGGQTAFSTGQGAVQLIGSPSGGVYSGPGVVGNSFNPSIAGVGTHVLTYTLSQGGCPTSASITVTVTTGGGQACTFPANVSAVPSASGAMIAWDPVAGAVSYQVRYRQVGTTSWIFRNVPATLNSLALTGLALNTTYQYQIRTTCSGNVISQFGPVGTFTTGDVAACLPPASLIVTNITSNSATVSFAAPMGGSQPTDYIVTLRFSGGPNADQIVEERNVDAGTSLSVLFENLLPQTAYRVEVRTNCGNTAATDLRSQTFTTLADITACDAPTQVVISNITETSATASWGATSGATDYTFGLTGGPGTINYGVQGSTTATLTDLLPGTAYTFTVRALCGDVQSDVATLTFTTVGTPAGCTNQTPSISSISLSTTTATVRWGNIAGASGYNLQYRLFGTTNFSSISVQATNAAVQQQQITGLTPGTRYEVRVTAICPGGNSNPSVIRRFQTLVGGKTGNVDVEFDDDISVYPNPGRGLLNLAFYGAWESQARVSIFDLMGRNVYQQTFAVGEGENVIEVDATSLGAGLYILKFESDTHSLATKIVIE